MKVFITGIGGMVGSGTAELLAKEGHEVTGCDSNQRRVFFGESGSVEWRIAELEKAGIKVSRSDAGDCHTEACGADLIIHAAGQPSHDYSFMDPWGDVESNYLATLALLEVCRQSTAKLIYLSTNKVYGDSVNTHISYRVAGEAPATRYVPVTRTYWCDPGLGVNEHCPVDNTRHTLFGISKLAADLAVQEYHHRYGLTACCFRCGCLAGTGGSPVEMHGFLGYLAKCAAKKLPYRIIGHAGHQVRDNLAIPDLCRAFLAWCSNPVSGVYNIGGGPDNSISVNEAIALLREWGYDWPVDHEPQARYGDHQWWISDIRKFNSLTDWRPGRSPRDVLHEVAEREQRR